MQHMTTTSGRVFIYDDNIPMLHEFEKMLWQHDLETFGTNNVYKLLQYSKEINPDVLIFEVDNEQTPAKATLNHIGKEINTELYPIIIVRPEGQKFSTYKEIAHYIHSPIDITKFIDIIESYCVGNKKHDIMLVSSYNEEKTPFIKQIEQCGVDYFHVHNEDAAKLYLTKNNPQIVCVEYSPTYISARHNLHHPHVFYVDSHQDITEIKNFLH